VAEPVPVRRLSDQEAQQVRQIVRRGSTNSVRYRRAMMLLASADGTGCGYRLVTTATTRPVKLGQPFARWLLRRIAAYLRKPMAVDPHRRSDTTPFGCTAFRRRTALMRHLCSGRRAGVP
jgi:hypothetical protein